MLNIWDLGPVQVLQVFVLFFYCVYGQSNIQPLAQWTWSLRQTSEVRTIKNINFSSWFHLNFHFSSSSFSFSYPSLRLISDWNGLSSRLRPRLHLSSQQSDGTRTGPERHRH